MKSKFYVALLLFLTATCFGQTVCPKHIEAPDYPALAAIAAIHGKVILRVTLDAEGKVTKAEVANDLAHPIQPVLYKSAIENMMHWTFGRPPSAPFTLVMVYEYKMDRSLPIEDHHNSTTKVKIDLPDHVTILHSGFVLNTVQTRKKSKSSVR